MIFFYIKIFFKTFGCNINKNESEKIFFLIKYFKILIIKEFLKSNIYIINSCIIRKNSQIKILKELKKYIFLKKYKKIIIILTGCYPEINEIWNFFFLKIDIIINSFANLFIKKILIFFLKNKKKIFFTKKKNYYNIKKINKFIQIMIGCNKNCTYCIIPQIKGKEKYFNFFSILKYIKIISKNFFSELTLLGQNVNSYNFEKINFCSLIYNISKIKNIKRINFFSSNISDFNKKYFYLYKNIKKISNHIHLPIQSGSNNILKKMNRNYSIFDYIFFIYKLKKIKNTTFSTDFIISFPNEKFEDFDNSLKILKKIFFFEIYFFLYSKRKNTISFNFKEQNFFLKKIKLSIFKKKIRNNLILKNERVLVIGYLKNNIFIGKMDNLKFIFFEYYKINIIGKIIKIKILFKKNNIYLGIYENIFVDC